MKYFQVLVAALCLGVIGLTACDRTQKREEAINRGEGPALAGVRQCQLLQGKWLGDVRGCKITKKSCPAVGGTWGKGIGCIVATREPDGCTNSSGLTVVDGQCVLAELSASDLDDAWSCHVAQGQWFADTRRCGMTAHLCAQSTGTWKPDIGCEKPSVTADQCNYMSGVHVIDNQCIMVDLSRDDLEQVGAEDIEQAHSRLNQ